MVFKCHKFLPVLFLIVSNLLPAISQTSEEEGSRPKDFSSYIREKHGLDQELINGIQYYNRYHRVLNHPYYSSEESVRGTINVSGKIYEDVKINYDVYSQFLVLEYQDEMGGIYKIIMHPSHIFAFEFEGYNFEKLTLDEGGPLFYQSIKVNGLSCYIHWRKELIATSNNLSNPETFTGIKLNLYLEYNDIVYPFKNAKTFALPFSIISKKEIKKYLRSNKIKFRDVSPEEIEGLLWFVSTKVHQIPEG